MSERLTYAIGDIHGRLDLLQLAADAIMDDLAGREGRVICLGDYVDRGPASKGVIEFLMKAQAVGSLICLKGNHEAMMLAALAAGPGTSEMAFWLRNGGEQTVRSYGGAEGVPAEHRTWMEGLPLVARDDHRAFVHAGFMPGVPLAQQDERACLWIRERFLTTDYDFGAHVVHGHTNQHEEKIETSEPELLPNRTNLDTGACYTGILTIGVFDQSQARPLRVLTVGEREE